MSTLPRLEGAQYATGKEQRNSSGKNEEAEPKQKQHPAVDVTGDGRKSDALKNARRSRADADEGGRG